MAKRKTPQLSDFIGKGDHQFKGSLLELDPGSARPIHQVAIHQLCRGRYQPRTLTVDDQDLKELEQSIRELGIIEPIAVRPLAEQDRYEILAGDRRWRAAQRAGLQQVPVIVHAVDDRTAAAIALVENLQRKDLNPIEEARAMHRLLHEFELSQGQVAEIVGVSQPAVSKCLGLLDLVPAVQQAIEAGRLDAGHGKVLLNLDPSQQTWLAEMAIRHDWSVRELEHQKITLGSTIGKKILSARRDPNIVQLENRIQTWLGAPVKLKYSTSSGKGRIEINFNSLDECNGILERFGLISKDD
jgi:ParB family chromosome partitioning protein